jgi:hypothetical protein
MSIKDGIPLKHIHLGSWIYIFADRISFENSIIFLRILSLCRSVQLRAAEMEEALSGSGMSEGGGGAVVQTVALMGSVVRTSTRSPNSAHRVMLVLLQNMPSPTAQTAFCEPLISNFNGAGQREHATSFHHFAMVNEQVASG